MSNSRTLLLTAFAFLSALAHAGDTGVDFFEKKIRPALVEHCYSCHSAKAEKIKGKLRVDSRTLLLKGGESGAAVVPGNLEKSLLVEAVAYSNTDLQMPPDKKLPAALIEDFKTWVKAGAVWPGDANDAKDEAVAIEKKLDYEKLKKEHWAFQPIKRSAVPTLKNTAWPNGPIDAFILAKLEEKEIVPTPEAEKATLLRRITFDLTGLPPTPDDIDAFTKDESPNAYEKVVDRLLASQHFGERWGRHWLDIARYAETAGGGRIVALGNAWRYRDYVIAAYNSDKPYNDFLNEQIAGDLIQTDSFDKRRENIIATGFLAIGAKNLDTQDKELLRMDVVDEQIDTVSKALLGMTTSCARCHDHKFDPIPTRDYYALAGIFRATKTLTAGNVSGAVQSVLPDAATREKIEVYEKQLAILDERYTKIRTTAGPKKAPVRGDKAAKNAVAAVTRSRSIDPATLPGIIIDDSQATLVGTWIKSTSTAPYVGAGYVHDNHGAAKGELSITYSPALPKDGMYDVRFSYSYHQGRATKVPVIIQHADGETTVHVNEEHEPPIDGAFVSLGRFHFHQGNDGSVTVSNAGTKGVVTADAVQFCIVDENAAAAPAQIAAPKTAIADPAKPVAPKSVADEEVATLKQIEKEIEELKKNAPAGPKALAVRDEEQVGDHNICLRGDVHRLGEQVPRGFMTAVTFDSPPVNVKQSGRLELARWITDARNPLTARVMANRVWHHLFGTGLVRSTDNFGITGDAPTNPDLLDNMAAHFMDNGWSIKKLVREIVLTKTYRQAATPNAAATKVDPENRLLWRANRRRLEAEAIRDAIVLNSGELDLSGSPGEPPTKAVTKASKSGAKSDVKEEPKSEAKPDKPKREHRSVYLPLTREEMNDMMEVFDFADTNLVVGVRNTSNLPTQALFLMNSPFVMDHARKASQRLMKMPNLDDSARIDLAYRMTLGRKPTESERTLSLKYLNAAGKDAWPQLYQALFACVDFRFVN
ncbi:MAG: DUF1553 domain-containing protein [Planctomycetota bacterium]